MKGDMGRTADLRRSLYYGLRTKGLKDDEGMPRVIGGNLAGVGIEELLEEFEFVAALRPDIERPFFHCSLSLDDEYLTRKQWAEASRMCLKLMGLDPSIHPFVAIQHLKPWRHHCHVYSSRVALDASLWTGEWEVLRFVDACQQIERRFDLRRTGGLLLNDPLNPMQRRPKRMAPSRRMIKANFRAGRLGLKRNDAARLKADLLRCSAHAVDRESFFALAESMDIELKLVYDSEGKEKGLTAKERAAESFVGLSHATNRELSLWTLDALFEGKLALYEAAIEYSDEARDNTPADTSTDSEVEEGVERPDGPDDTDRFSDQ